MYTVQGVPIKNVNGEKAFMRSSLLEVSIEIPDVKIKSAREYLK